MALDRSSHKHYNHHMDQRLRELLEQEEWTQRELWELRRLTQEHNLRYEEQEQIIYRPKQEDLNSTEIDETDIFPRDTGLH